DAVRLRERPHDELRRQAEHAAERGVPRARLRRGHVRARVSVGRARGEARRRPARAATTELRRLGPHRRASVLVEEPRRALPSRGPYAAISAGSSTVPSMGPAVRAAAADAKRQLIEIAAQRHHLEERVLDVENGEIVSADSGSWPLTEITGMLDDGQILGKGA